MSTCGTENPGNTKEDDMVSHPEFTVISAIPDERTSETAGTGDLSKVQRIDDFIIKILRNRVVKIHFNSYHNPVFDTKTVKKVPKSQQICGLWDFLKFLTYTLRVLFFRLSKNFSHFIYWDDFF